MYRLASCISFFWGENVYSDPLSILKLCYLFFYHWVIWFIFWILTPCQKCGWQIFSPILYLAFLIFHWWLPLLCRRFFVWCNPTCLFSFCFLYFLCQIQKIIAKTSILGVAHQLLYFNCWLFCFDQGIFISLQSWLLNMSDAILHV